MNCINCSNTAMYIYKPDESLKVPYCVTHLPSFLKGRANAGLMEVTEASKQEVEEVIALLNKIAEPVADTIVETPAASKKTIKKPTEVQPDAE